LKINAADVNPDSFKMMLVPKALSKIEGTTLKSNAVLSVNQLLTNSIQVYDEFVSLVEMLLYSSIGGMDFFKYFQCSHCQSTLVQNKL
jgi:hypothetical protein